MEKNGLNCGKLLISLGTHWIYLEEKLDLYIEIQANHPTLK